MALIITEDCTSCDACLDECPNQAITEGDDIYIIESARCTECVGFFDTPQCADVCPVDCCDPDPDKEETEDLLVARARVLHPDEAIAESGFPSHLS